MAWIVKTCGWGAVAGLGFVMVLSMAMTLVGIFSMFGELRSAMFHMQQL